MRFSTWGLCSGPWSPASPASRSTPPLPVRPTPRWRQPPKRRCSGPGGRRELDGSVAVGRTVLPASLAVEIMPLELLVHGWDIAHAVRHRCHTHGRGLRPGPRPGAHPDRGQAGSKLRRRGRPPGRRPRSCSGRRVHRPGAVGQPSSSRRSRLSRRPDGPARTHRRTGGWQEFTAARLTTVPGGRFRPGLGSRLKPPEEAVGRRTGRDLRPSPPRRNRLPHQDRRVSLPPRQRRGEPSSTARPRAELPEHIP